MEKQDYVKSLMEYPSVQEMIECERAEGIQIGIEQGIKQGIEQGIEQGLAQGMAEGEAQSTRNIARNLLKRGFEVSVISDVTGLDETEIRSLEAN